jgi:hypothetical protein
VKTVVRWFLVLSRRHLINRGSVSLFAVLRRLDHSNCHRNRQQLHSNIGWPHCDRTMAEQCTGPAVISGAGPRTQETNESVLTYAKSETF